MLQNTQGSFLPIPAAVGRRVVDVPGVAVVSPTKSTNVEVLTDGAGKTLATGVDPATAAKIWYFDFAKGNESVLDNLGPNQVILNKNYAASNDFKVGDKLKIKGSTGAAPTFTVVGTIDDDSGFLGKVDSPERGDEQRLRRARRQPRLRRHGPRSAGQGAAGTRRQAAEDRVPDGRVQEPGSVQGPDRVAGQQPGDAVLRAAVAVDHRLAVRHRQHAGAVDHRAHARAGHDARDRNVAAAGADESCATSP